MATASCNGQHTKSVNDSESENGVTLIMIRCITGWTLINFIELLWRQDYPALLKQEEEWLNSRIECMQRHNIVTKYSIVLLCIYILYNIGSNLACIAATLEWWGLASHWIQPPRQPRSTTESHLGVAGDDSTVWEHQEQKT